MIPCPHCGEAISEDARSCRHCGSDSDTGWNDDQDYYSVELPDDEAQDPPEYRQDRLRAIGLLVLVGLLGSYFVLGPGVWRWFRTPVGRVIALVGVFAITLSVLRLLRRNRPY